MEGKRYRWIWWLVAVLLLAGVIWYTVAKNQTEEYTDGTLVWNPADTFYMTNRNYCHLLTISKPSSYKGGLEICQKPSI